MRPIEGPPPSWYEPPDEPEDDAQAMGLSINALMRNVLIEHGLPYARASEITDAFGYAFDNQTGTTWIEINGTTSWSLSFDGREQD